ncbi:hypothetical protein G3G77_004223 [Salmonella enterica]|nr:hypothetical protein [Salmonella enterica]EEH5466095.1 hypothetical protein [Salmonella enterica]EEH7555539.1 hypothetical protein [Salmonella enterica]
MPKEQPRTKPEPEKMLISDADHSGWFASYLLYHTGRVAFFGNSAFRIQLFFPKDFPTIQIYLNMFLLLQIVVYTDCLLQKMKWNSLLLNPEIFFPVNHFNRKRTPRAVLTGMCYSVGSVMRQGSSSLTRGTGQSTMTAST